MICCNESFQKLLSFVLISQILWDIDDLTWSRRSFYSWLLFSETTSDYQRLSQSKIHQEALVTKAEQSSVQSRPPAPGMAGTRLPPRTRRSLETPCLWFACLRLFNFGDNTTLAIFLNYPTIIPRDVSHLMKPCPLCSCGLLLYVSLRGLQGPDGWHHWLKDKTTIMKACCLVNI